MKTGKMTKCRICGGSSSNLRSHTRDEHPGERQPKLAFKPKPTNPLAKGTSLLSCAKAPPHTRG